MKKLLVLIVILASIVMNQVTKEKEPTPTEKIEMYLEAKRAYIDGLY